MRSPGQVLGHSQLLDAAWDIGQEYRSNVIEVYVRYLRGKIDARSAYGRWRPYVDWVTGCDATAAAEKATGSQTRQPQPSMRPGMPSLVRDLSMR